ASIQSLRDFDGYKTRWNISNIPGPFIRSGISMGFANRGQYGYNYQSKDELMEYKIVDADFRYEYAPNVGDEIVEIDQIGDFNSSILELEEELLGNQQRTNDGKKCLSWEVDFVQAGSKGNCRGCLRGDQHSVFGYPCSTRGKTEQEGRNIDGTSKIGVFDEEQCVFSHCKIGYYRKNVNVNGLMKDQCILILLGYNETRSEVTPNQTEDAITQNDKCGNPIECKAIAETTSTDTCPCPSDQSLLQQDPRKDGLCKCAIITSTTPINLCACPTDPTQLNQSALNIVGVGVLVQHFIFAYIPPLSFVNAIDPMISINVGSISDWNVLASGQRNVVPNYLTHSFTDCIFQGSNNDYGSGQKYGNAIGPLLSKIGTKVTIENCQLNTKENIQLLKVISSAMISAVSLYPDANTFQSEIVLKETGILNLTGNNKTQSQLLTSANPSTRSASLRADSPFELMK
ncbi:MAG: hypothetical protein EZS28_040943, partial [Streblomastix strix]